MSQDQRSAQARSRDVSSAKKTPMSRSLCSSAIPLAMLPATYIPTTPWQPRKKSATRSRARRCSEGKELDSTAHVEADAGDVGGEVGAEKRDRVRDVLRIPRSPERGAIRHALEHLRFREPQRLRRDDPGDDRIARDAKASAFERKRLRQAQDPRLGRRVARLPEAAERSCDRRHVDRSEERR